ncbi:MAG: hypothetical protein SGARI_007339, partial [Bacillariaceae sp.]
MTVNVFRVVLVLATIADTLPTGNAFFIGRIGRKTRPVSCSCCRPLFAAQKGFGGGSASKGKKKGKKQKTITKPLQYTPDTSEKTRRLLEWLDEEEIEGVEGAEIGFSTMPDGTKLRGVFAKQEFSRGDYILAVPFVSTLLVKEDFEATNDIPLELMLASEPENGLLFWQQFFNKDHSSQHDEKYQAYLDCLPMSRDDPHFDETPDFWSDEEIERIKVPSLIQKTQSLKKAIHDLATKYNKENPNNMLT